MSRSPWSQRAVERSRALAPIRAQWDALEDSRAAMDKVMRAYQQRHADTFFVIEQLRDELKSIGVKQRDLEMRLSRG